MNGASRPKAAHTLRDIQSSNDASGAFTSSLVAPPPTEPLERLEPTASSLVKGRLYGDSDGSNGIRDETAARVRALGVDTPLHQSGPCVLHGQEHAARVVFATWKGREHPTAGRWHYYCDGLSKGIGLADVRAFIAYGGERRISNLEAARWRELLDFEAGLRLPVPLKVELPEPCPEPARMVAGAMRLFVGLRDARFPLAEPFVFGGDFAPAYCGLSADQVRSAKDWLDRAGVILRVGKHGRSILWKLAAQDRFAEAAESRGGP